MVGFICIESNPGAVVRPRGTPGLKMPLGDLNRSAAGRRDYVKVIPSVLIGEVRDPAAVGRRLRLGSGLPVGETPEFLLVVFVDRLRLAVFYVGNINRASLILVRLASEDNPA